MRSMVINEEVNTLIQAVDKADSADELLEAVKALAAVRHEAAIPKLVEVLGYNNPGAAVAAVERTFSTSLATGRSTIKEIGFDGFRCDRIFTCGSCDRGYPSRE
jgi:HEAT repeat protein